MMKDDDGFPAKAKAYQLGFRPELEPDLSFGTRQLVATHRDHRHATPPRQASREPTSVTSLSVRPVTFLSVIYTICLS
jgi:hypothetical protein